MLFNNIITAIFECFEHLIIHGLPVIVDNMRYPVVIRFHARARCVEIDYFVVIVN